MAFWSCPVVTASRFGKINCAVGCFAAIVSFTRPNYTMPGLVLSHSFESFGCPKPEPSGIDAVVVESLRFEYRMLFIERTGHRILVRRAVASRKLFQFCDSQAVNHTDTVEVGEQPNRRAKGRP